MRANTTNRTGASNFAPGMDAGRDLTLRDYGRVVRRRKWIVVIAVGTALLGALVMTLLQDPIYEAEAQMLVEPRSGEEVFQQDPTLKIVGRLAKALTTRPSKLLAAAEG